MTWAVQRAHADRCTLATMHDAAVWMETDHGGRVHWIVACPSRQQVAQELRKLRCRALPPRRADGARVRRVLHPGQCWMSGDRVAVLLSEEVAMRRLGATKPA
jgi:hypothetical protein